MVKMVEIREAGQPFCRSTARTWLSRWVVLALAGGLGSACGGTGEEAGQEPLTFDGALSATESCDSVAASSTMTGGGNVLTPDSYHVAGCAQGYRLDLTNYDAKYDQGTFVAFAGAAPPTQARCEKLRLAAYVWRKEANGKSTYLDNRSRTGSWQADAFGQMRCTSPSMILEDEIEGFEAGASYRIAMRAQETSADGSTFTSKPIYVETLKTRPKFRTVMSAKHLSALRVALDTTTVDADLEALWNARSKPGVQMFCRSLALDLSLEEVMLEVPRALGATAAALNSRFTTNSEIVRALCKSPNAGRAELQTLQANIVRSITLTEKIASEIASALGTPGTDALLAWDQLVHYGLDRVNQTCGSNPAELMTFVQNGRSPAGMLGPNVLLRNCTGNIGNIRGQALLAMTSNPFASFDNNVLEQCMNEGAADMNRTCNDPRASGDDGARGASGGADSVNCALPENARLCNALQVREALERDIASADGNVAATQAKLDALTAQLDADIGRNAASAADLNRRADILAKVEPGEASWAQKTLYGAVGGAIGWIVGKIIKGDAGGAGGAIAGNGLGAVIEELDKQERKKTIDTIAARHREAAADAAEEMDRLCQARPESDYCKEKEDRPSGGSSGAGGGGSNRCPGFEFDTGVGYYGASTELEMIMGLARARPITGADRMNHCMCKHLGERLSGGACEDPTERARQECLTNPFGPAGRPPLVSGAAASGASATPRAICMKLLQPSNIDMNAWRAQMCQLIYPNCANDYITESGECGCGNTPLPVDTVAARCPNRFVTDCGPDSTLDLKTCNCQGFDAGEKPWGGRPGCANDNTAFPGGADQWPGTGRVWTDDIRIAGQAKRVLRVEPGPNVVVTSPLRLNDFVKDLGSGLEITYALPQKLSSVDWRGQTNVHMTIGNRLFNEHVGRIEHSQLTVGGLSTAALNLSANHLNELRRARDNNEEVRFALFVNTNALPAGRRDLDIGAIAVGLSGFDFRGAARPVAQRSPQCPDPQEGITPDLLGPGFLLPGTKTIPVDWRFRELLR
jgi:hypothetical protein